MSKPPPIDYATPQPRLRRDITSIPLTLALAVPTLALYVAAFLVVPRFERIFFELKTELPAVTQMTLRFASWMSAWGWIVLWTVPVLIPMVLTQLTQSLRPAANRAGRTLWTLNLGLFFTLLVVLWLALALFLPQVRLMQQLSSPK